MGSGFKLFQQYTYHYKRNLRTRGDDWIAKSENVINGRLTSVKKKKFKHQRGRVIGDIEELSTDKTAQKDNDVFNNKQTSTSRNTSDGKNVNKVCFGKVTQVKHFEINSYFPNEIVSPVQYRLKLSQYFLNDAGELLRSSIHGENDLLFSDQTINHKADLRTNLHPGELPAESA